MRLIRHADSEATKPHSDEAEDFDDEPVEFDCVSTASSSSNSSGSASSEEIKELGAVGAAGAEEEEAEPQPRRRNSQGFIELDAAGNELLSSSSPPLLAAVKKSSRASARKALKSESSALQLQTQQLVQVFVILVAGVLASLALWVMLAAIATAFASAPVPSYGLGSSAGVSVYHGHGGELTAMETQPQPMVVVLELMEELHKLREEVAQDRVERLRAEEDLRASQPLARIKTVLEAGLQRIQQGLSRAPAILERSTRASRASIEDAATALRTKMDQLGDSILLGVHHADDRINQGASQVASRVSEARQWLDDLPARVPSVNLGRVESWQAARDGLHQGLRASKQALLEWWTDLLHRASQPIFVWPDQQEAQTLGCTWCFRN